jgi:hypothetical protein
MGHRIRIARKGRIRHSSPNYERSRSARNVLHVANEALDDFLV